MKQRSGGNILVESLHAHGVKKVFCVPGESYLDALDALHDAKDIRTVACRHEGGAAFMAEAYAKLTGRAGICFVTRGPGACNAAIGVHTAMQDSTPMILFVGQVARDQMGHEAFQEIDYRRMFQPPIVKWAVQIEKAKDIPAIVRQAFETALSGRPGPVVVALPEDMLCEESDAIVPPPAEPAHFGPAPAQVARIREVLSAARRPLAIVGGGSWTDPAIAAFAAFCRQAEIPVAAGFRRQDAFPNAHPCYAGALGTTVDPKLLKSVQAADVILAVGTRLGEILTQGYTIIAPPAPKQMLIHVYPDATEFGRVYQPALAVHSDVASFARALEGVQIEGAPRAAWRQALHADYEAFSAMPKGGKFSPDLDDVTAEIIQALPEDAVITTDAGNFSGWPQRYLKYDRPRRLLAPTSGAMGYGVPAAIAASMAMPERAVVGFMGDGGFLMTGSEIAAAMAQGAKPVLLVFNNSMYGTIRMHQELHYPGRVSATGLVNPDFAAYARSFGAHGEVVMRTEEFAPAFRRALAAQKLSVIEVRMDPQQITTSKKLSELSG